MKKVNCFYANHRNNFGDMLSPIIIKEFLGATCQHVPDNTHNKLLICGSILGRMKTGDIICGAGAMRNVRYKVPKGVKFYAVRGPLTKRKIEGARVPGVYGDPALLMPEIYSPSIKKHYEYGLFPHYTDYPKVKRSFPDEIVINPRGDVKGIIRQVLACEMIFASSLHGIIIADAYGIPTSWVKMSDLKMYMQRGGSGFKYLDYMASVGRKMALPILWHDLKKRGDKSSLMLPPPDIDLLPLKRAFQKLKEDLRR